MSSKSPPANNSTSGDSQNLKDIEQNLKIMKNRVYHLRRQEEKQKRSIKLNKQKARQVLIHKIQLSEMGNAEFNPEEEAERQELLRKRSQAQKAKHEKQLQNIMKAIYLVKVDDARQIRSMSRNHQKRVQEIKLNSLEFGKERRLEAHRATERRRQSQARYLKQKMMMVARDRNKSASQAEKVKEECLEEISHLQGEEAQLMETINRRHSQSLMAKKQYYAAKTLPMRSVAESMEQFEKSSRSIDTREQTSALGAYSQRAYSMVDIKDMRVRNNEIRVPNSTVDEGKLKIVLQQLKRGS